LANARFALTVDPSNALLKARAGEVARQREAGEFTLPTTIAIELATNPFLRATTPQSRLGLAWLAPIPPQCSPNCVNAKIAFELCLGGVTLL